MIGNCTIRSATPADASRIARIYVDTWRATYAGILPQSYLAQMNCDRIALSVQGALMNPQVDCLVAESDRHGIGYIAGGLERTYDPIYRAEIYELYLLPAFQGAGTGSRLLAALAQRLSRRGLHTMKVWVLSANPYRRFYVSRGAVRLGSKSIRFADRRLKIDAFGWIDITQAAGDTIYP